ncbi:hypothetical protein [Celeribacter indicus]|uniref:hypothetical protein n=1 Tax=Celeribacter indicus TaxID=1208324 RepID=UPI0005C33D32|nr:hypothetical protein [Celeribacter indicus]
MSNGSDDREIVSLSPIPVKALPLVRFCIRQGQFGQFKGRRFCFTLRAENRMLTHYEETLSLKIVKSAADGVERLYTHSLSCLPDAQSDFPIVICFRPAPLKPDPYVQGL